MNNFFNSINGLISRSSNWVLNHFVGWIWLQWCWIWRAVEFLNSYFFSVHEQFWHLSVQGFLDKASVFPSISKTPLLEKYWFYTGNIWNECHSRSIAFRLKIVQMKYWNIFFTDTSAKLSVYKHLKVEGIFHANIVSTKLLFQYSR